MSRLLVTVGLWLARCGGWVPGYRYEWPAPELKPASWPHLASLYAKAFGPIFTAIEYRPLRIDMEYHGFLSRSVTDDALDATGRVDPCRMNAHEGRRTFLLRIQSIVDTVTREGVTP